MTAKETLSLVSKQWCDLEDLTKLTELGRNNVLKIRRDIKKYIEEKGYMIINNKLPMCEVVNYLKIDINYLKKMVN